MSPEPTQFDVNVDHKVDGGVGGVVVGADVVEEWRERDRRRDAPELDYGHTCSARCRVACTRPKHNGLPVVRV